MTKRFALALCVTTLLGGAQSVSAGAAPLLEEGKSGRGIIAKKALLSFKRAGSSALSVRRASIRRASYRRVVRSVVSRRSTSMRSASYRRGARSIVSRRSISMRRISLASGRRNIRIARVAPVVNSIQAVSVNYIAPKPTVVAVPETVRTAPSVQEVSLSQPTQEVQNESLINRVVAPVVQDPAPVEEVNAPSRVVVNEAPAAVYVPEQVPDQAITPPVITSLPDPLYDDVEGVPPVASSSLSNTLLAWEGLTALLSGKEPLSRSCYKTEVNTDDPRLININDQVSRLTNVPQENGGEALLNYSNIFHAMTPDDFEKELSQHKQSVKKAAELSLALQDYEKSVANDPNRLEQLKQVGQSLLDRAQCLVDLGARFDHLSRKRSEEAQLSSSQPYSSALAASHIEEREVNLPRRTSSPSLEYLQDSLDLLMQSKK